MYSNYSKGSEYFLPLCLFYWKTVMQRLSTQSGVEFQCLIISRRLVWSLTWQLWHWQCSLSNTDDSVMKDSNFSSQFLCQITLECTKKKNLVPLSTVNLSSFCFVCNKTKEIAKTGENWTSENREMPSVVMKTQRTRQMTELITNISLTLTVSVQKDPSAPFIKCF